MMQYTCTIDVRWLLFLLCFHWQRYIHPSSVSSPTEKKLETHASAADLSGVNAIKVMVGKEMATGLCHDYQSEKEQC